MAERRLGKQEQLRLPQGERFRELQRTYYPTTVVELNGVDADIEGAFCLSPNGRAISDYDLGLIRQGRRRIGVVHELKYKDGTILAGIDWILIHEDKFNPEEHELDTEKCWYRLSDLPKFSTIVEIDTLKRSEAANMPAIGSRIGHSLGTMHSERQLVTAVRVASGHMHPSIDENGQITIQWRFRGYFNPREPDDTTVSKIVMFDLFDPEFSSSPPSTASSLCPGLTYKKKPLPIPQP